VGDVDVAVVGAAGWASQYIARSAEAESEWKKLWQAYGRENLQAVLRLHRALTWVPDPALTQALAPRAFTEAGAITVPEPNDSSTAAAVDASVAALQQSDMEAIFLDNLEVAAAVGVASGTEF
jgi:hypothetical protein